MVARVHLAGEDAVLVVVEVAMTHGEAQSFLPDARAVLVRHAAFGELDPLHRGAIALDHPDRLIAPAHAIGLQVRESAHATQKQVIRLPACHIGWIGACGDVHRVAVRHQCGDLAGHRVGETGTDLPGGGVQHQWERTACGKCMLCGTHIAKVGSPSLEWASSTISAS